MSKIAKSVVTPWRSATGSRTTAWRTSRPGPSINQTFPASGSLRRQADNRDAQALRIVTSSTFPTLIGGYTSTGSLPMTCDDDHWFSPVRDISCDLFSGFQANFTDRRALFTVGNFDIQFPSSLIHQQQRSCFCFHQQSCGFDGSFLIGIQPRTSSVRLHAKVDL